MTTPSSRAPLAGGFLIALGVIVGSIIGAAKGQSTVGFLFGLGIGVAMAIAVWGVDRSRRG